MMIGPHCFEQGLQTRWQHFSDGEIGFGIVWLNISFR